MTTNYFKSMQLFCRNMQKTYVWSCFPTVLCLQLRHRRNNQQSFVWTNVVVASTNRTRLRERQNKGLDGFGGFGTIAFARSSKPTPVQMQLWPRKSAAGFNKHAAVTDLGSHRTCKNLKCWAPGRHQIMLHKKHNSSAEDMIEHFQPIIGRSYQEQHNLQTNPLRYLKTVAITLLIEMTRRFASSHTSCRPNAEQAIFLISRFHAAFFLWSKTTQWYRKPPKNEAKMRNNCSRLASTTLSAIR